MKRGTGCKQNPICGFDLRGQGARVSHHWCFLFVESTTLKTSVAIRIERGCISAPQLYLIIYQQFTHYILCLIGFWQDNNINNCSVNALFFCTWIRGCMYIFTCMWVMELKAQLSIECICVMCRKLLKWDLHLVNA